MNELTLFIKSDQKPRFYNYALRIHRIRDISYARAFTYCIPSNFVSEATPTAKNKYTVVAAHTYKINSLHEFDCENVAISNCEKFFTKL